MTSAVPHKPFVCRWTFLLFLVGLSLTASDRLLAQADSSVAQPPSAPESAQPKKDFRFAVGWLSSVGIYSYVPEKWGELHINLVNRRDEARELSCVTSFDINPTLQYGRRVWVPAQSKLQISHPILVPKLDPAKGRNVNLHSLILEGSSAEDSLVKNESGLNSHDGALIVTHSLRNTGLITTPTTTEESLPQDVTSLINAARKAQHLSSKVVVLSDTFLPVGETGLDMLDHVFITENRITNDLAALSALRHWVNAGGHLWIMLDKADPIVLEQLLGDDFSAQLIDRVGLNSVRIDRSPTVANPSSMIGTPVEYEVPVEHARIIANNWEVTHTVNGWPVVMNVNYGDGKIYVSTLGPRGWLIPRSSSSLTVPIGQTTSDHVLTAVMSDLIGEFFAQRESELLPQSDLDPRARDYIGYSVPSWGLIIGTLCGFSLALSATGLWLLRSSRLEHLGWVGSLMAIGFSVFLLLVGRSYRHGVPATIASVQYAQAATGTDDVQTQGVIAVYHPEGSDSQIQTQHGGRMFPDMTGLEGSQRRMIYTDLGIWHWENLKQPAGLRTSSFSKMDTIIPRVQVLATFDNGGVTGTYSGGIALGNDAFLGTRSGRMGIDFRPDGTFTARVEDLFEKDQYLSAGLLGDEQNRRRQILEKLFTNPKRRDFPNRPQLFFWTSEFDNGFEFSKDLKRQGTTLVSVPLVFDRPPNGTEIVIPAPFLSYRHRPHPDGTQPSSMWNYSRNEWQDRSTPGSTWLRFQVPAELLPLTATRARINIKVSGPIGKIEISGLKNGSFTNLSSILDPVGSVSIEINDPSVLPISEDGGLVLGLSAGDPSRPELTATKTEETTSTGSASGVESASKITTKVNYWRIESLALQLWAKTSESTAIESTSKE